LLRDAFGNSGEFVSSNQEIDDLRVNLKLIMPYFILFTPRSGSTFLTFELSKASVLSRPHEWFHFGLIPKINKDKLNFSGYVMDIIKKINQKMEYLDLKSIGWHWKR
jgi:hypothetical protein